MKCGERRAAIVKSAIRLFAEKGFRGATTRELATGLGVSEPVLYQHFQTKNDLYAAIIEAKVEESRQLVCELEKRLSGDDDRAILTHLAELVFSHYEQDTDFIRLFLFSALERHELARDFYHTHVIRFHEMVIGYIRRRIRAGAFRGVNPQTAARAFTGMIQGHGLTTVLLDSPAPKSGRRQKNKLIGEIVSIFLDGIRVHSMGAKK
jgi:AcrR family transcriptional regulator